jgi:lipoate-protein ligase A
MKLLDLTLDPPVANIALDEALLEFAETSEDHPEVLRLWEPLDPLVVLGRSSPISSEANLDYCRSENIKVIRRCSGGQSIVTGRGCLMYAVLLDYRLRPELRMLEQAHHFVMSNMQKAIESVGLETKMEGTSDLTFKGRKFSGNALRCKRNWIIYHGTMICEFDISLISKCLGNPIRQPQYRQQRSHQEFLVQLPVTTSELAVAIANQWSAYEPLNDWPNELTDKLIEEKYDRDDWNQKI